MTTSRLRKQLTRTGLCVLFAAAFILRLPNTARAADQHSSPFHHTAIDATNPVGSATICDKEEQFELGHTKTEACTWYVKGEQGPLRPGVRGAYAYMSQHRPRIDPDARSVVESPFSAGEHSLAEVAVFNHLGNKQYNAIELGWVVAPDMFSSDGDHASDPHLFVKPTKGAQRATVDCWGEKFWQNKTPEEVEKTCGWHQVSKTYFPNKSRVAADGTRQPFGIYLCEGNWWVYYANEWIGYLPGSFWENQFTSISHAQWYGEVQVIRKEILFREIPILGRAEDAERGDCTEMGNGRRPPDPRAAVITSMGLFNQDGQPKTAEASPVVTDRQRYDIGGIGDMPFSSFSYGGYPC